MKTEYLNNDFLEDTMEIYKKSRLEKVRFETIIEDLRSSIAKRRKNKKKSVLADIDHYHSEYIRAAGDFDTAQKQLTKSFYTLTERLIGYCRDIIVDTDDALQEGVCACFEKLNKFTKGKGKAFNYLTTCVMNHFRQMYRGHKSYKLFKERYKEFMSNKFSSVLIKNKREIHIKDINMD